MAYTVQVKDSSADRFRAYAAAKLLRKPTMEDNAKRAADDKPMLTRGNKIRYDGEEIAFSGDVKDKTFKISAGETSITRVALYKGDVEEEVCVGSVEVGASGDIEIVLEDAPEEQNIVDE